MNDTLQPSPVRTAPRHVALIGFGEAGAALAEGWRDTGVNATLAAYDIKAASADNTLSDAMWARYDAFGVEGRDRIEDALAGADAVFSLVTADQALRAAEDAAPHLGQDVLYFDCNSCASGTKQAARDVVEARGAHYVDTAIMSPIRPKRHEAPVLVSGPHVRAATETMEALGMTPGCAGDEVGMASATKMLRSVMIKGIEALTLECLLAAREAGVDDKVLASLNGSMPGWDWASRAAYNMERSTTHGVRRAVEMRDVARTVEDLGIAPRMAAATAEWQQDMGDLGLDFDQSPGTDSYQDRADAIRDALRNANRRIP